MKKKRPRIHIWWKTPSPNDFIEMERQHIKKMLESMMDTEFEKIFTNVRREQSKLTLLERES
jgi:hypothetical protein